MTRIADTLRSANYAQSTITKKSTVAHFPTSTERKTTLDIIRWCYAVAGIPADSPRFCYYVSRWSVPEKIARAHATGTFDATTANCPPIDLAWIRFVPAALAAYHEFAAQHGPSHTTTDRPPDVSRKPDAHFEKAEGLPAAHFSDLA